MANIADTIIKAASLLTALGLIVGGIVKMAKFKTQQEHNTHDIKEIRGEQKLVFTALCACLDGLQQLGANHSVPVAKAKLEEWLNDKAHD